METGIPATGISNFVNAIHIDTLIPFAEFLGHKSSDILVFGEVLDIDKYYPRHISVQIGAYIDVDATGENSVDLRESCILYQITQDYYNLDGWRPMSFPGHFFDPPEYHFRYIEPSTLERITGKITRSKIRIYYRTI